MHPSSFPEVKYASGIDTFFAIIGKVITIVFLSITVARYAEGWMILHNVPLLSFAAGAALIAETPVIFMLSQPWGQAWWLAHNIYAASFLVIGFGLYFSMKYKELEFFDVAQQINKFVQQISQQKAEIEKHNYVLQKELVEVGELQKRSMLQPYSNPYLEIEPIYIPHSFASGDSYDFIWDEDRSVLGGVVLTDGQIRLSAGGPYGLCLCHICPGMGRFRLAVYGRAVCGAPHVRGPLDQQFSGDVHR